ncbi:Hydroxyacylglutathione hydrolase [Clarias magur]|uniref:Hydroxyacylglutathione hydrolase n=1 Tax=Clarias magur TaxID=1594786 RepID=A0A8J4TM05_CLAMG|nr:Hydroxyacylglutathione hydrolase [Clarias magur]
MYNLTTTEPQVPVQIGSVLCFGRLRDTVESSQEEVKWSERVPCRSVSPQLCKTAIKSAGLVANGDSICCDTLEQVFHSTTFSSGSGTVADQTRAELLYTVSVKDASVTTVNVKPFLRCTDPEWKGKAGFPTQL